MSPVVRLLTVADLRDDAHVRRISVAARLYAVLDDGRRVLLLDDRGWSGGLAGAGATEVADIWALSSEQEVAQAARMVVGPDEPFDGRSPDDMETDHFTTLAQKLRGSGHIISAGELQLLPHEVVLGEPLRARLGRGSDDA